MPSRTICRSPACPQRKIPSRSITNVDRQATLRSSSSTPYARIAVRWTSLSRGNENVRASWNAVWQNGVSPLIATSVAPRSASFAATWPRPPSSGVQMLPQS